MRTHARLVAATVLLVGLAACGGKQPPPSEPRTERDVAAEDARADSIARADSLRRARAEAAASLCEEASAAMADGDYDRARELYERARSEYGGTECAEHAASELPRLEKISAIRAMIHFEFDRSAITDEAARVLRRKAEVLRDNPGVRIVVEGHCDERGSNEYNMALGQRRAASAKQYLLELGVPAKTIVRTVSYGEERPLVDRSTEQAWAMNRRAEFAIQDLGGI